MVEGEEIDICMNSGTMLECTSLLHTMHVHVLCTKVYMYGCYTAKH